MPKGSKVIIFFTVTCLLSLILGLIAVNIYNNKDVVEETIANGYTVNDKNIESDKSAVIIDTISNSPSESDQKFIDFYKDYEPNYSPLKITDSVTDILRHPVDEIDFTDVNISFRNYVWWLDVMLPNYFQDFNYSATLNSSNNVVEFTYSSSDSDIFNENKDEITQLITDVGNHSMYGQLYGVKIKYIEKK